MKKLFTFLLLANPLLVYSQSAAPIGNNSDMLGTILVIILIMLAIFLLLREVVCWYYKINKIVSNQTEIIRLLNKIANNTANKDSGLKN